MNGKKVVISKTITAHIVGKKNTKATNAKSIKVNKTSYTLNVGKTAKINAKTIKVDKNKPILGKSHTAEFRYATSDKTVATVDKNGKITAKKTGSCVVYVYAVNGYAKKIKVTVK